MIQLFLYVLILIPLPSFACDDNFPMMHLFFTDKMEKPAVAAFDPYDYSDSANFGRLSLEDTSLESVPRIIQELFESEENGVKRESDVIHVISSESSGESIKIFGLSDEDVKRFEGKKDFSECFELSSGESDKSLMKRWCHAIVVDYMGKTMEKKMDVDKSVAKILAMAALLPKEKEIVIAEVPIVTDEDSNTQLTMTAFGNKVLFLKLAIPIKRK